VYLINSVNKALTTDSKNTSSIFINGSSSTSSYSSIVSTIVDSKSSEVVSSSSSSSTKSSTQATTSTNDINQKKWSEIMVSSDVKAMKDYYVSPNGSDTYLGTKESPFKSIDYAKAVAAKFKGAIDSDITVYLTGGEYRLLDTIHFNEEAFSTGNHKVIFKAMSGQTPIVSAGKKISGWQQVTVNGLNIYKAKVSGVDYVRQLYVNDKSEPRAALEGTYNWSYKSTTDKTGITVKDVDLSKVQNPSSMEVVWVVEWKIFVHLANSIDGNTINMQQPYFKFTTSAIDAGADPDGYYFPNQLRHKLSIQNDISFINTPGEWYYDNRTQEIYYYPSAGISMSNADCYIPVIEEIMNFEGVPSAKIRNIEFNGITFKYAANNLASKYGIAINQAQTYISGITSTTSGGISIPYDFIKGNINLENTDGINFINCVFKNLGAAAINVSKGAHHTTIQGCVFTDLSDSAVVIGSDKNASASDTMKVMYTTFDNNIIRRVAKDYAAMPAVSGYYAAYTKITNNDIYDVPYSAITLGWGWGNISDSTPSHDNIISGNKIGKYLQRARDGGGIYTLGYQPNSFIQNNYIFDQGEAFGGIYPDEGSAYFKISDNVVDNNQQVGNEEFCWLWVNGRIGSTGKLTCYNLNIDNNYTSNTRQHMTWQTENSTLTNTVYVTNNQWPDAAKTIMNNAGLKSEFKYLLEKYGN